MVEIQALQNKQKREIEELFKGLGKTLPSMVVPPTIAMTGGRRRPAKGKGNKSSRSGVSQASSAQQGMKLIGLPLTVIFGDIKCEQMAWSLLYIKLFWFCLGGKQVVHSGQSSVNQSATVKKTSETVPGSNVHSEGMTFVSVFRENVKKRLIKS